MYVERCKKELARLSETYPNLLLVASPQKLERVNWTNAEFHNPFLNGDLEFIKTLETALLEGRQAVLSAFGNTMVNVLTAKRGCKIF